jgi:hypothetical protein
MLLLFYLLAKIRIKRVTDIQFRAILCIDKCGLRCGRVGTEVAPAGMTP